MKSGSAALAYLRANTKSALAAYGFIIRGLALREAVGSGCTLTCELYPGTEMTSVYQIDVTLGGKDWFIPFGQGEARYCDVPRGEPDGTLVVTYPMNGCALEVRDVDGKNRFFHDSDGKSLPALASGSPKFRLVYAKYAGMTEPTKSRAERYLMAPSDEGKSKPFKVTEEGPQIIEERPFYKGNWEHTILCIKRGAKWDVYSSAIILLKEMNSSGKGFANNIAWPVRDAPLLGPGAKAEESVTFAD